MDPYIEHRKIWSDFHGGLAEVIRSELNKVITPKYVARMTPYVTYEIVEIAQKRGIRPDVGIYESSPPTWKIGETAVIYTPTPVKSTIPVEFPLRLLSVEIVIPQEEMRPVTAIEILSPVNKKPDHEAYDHYLRKRREILRSDVHLLEIDLLRSGTRPPLAKEVPTAPYYVTLSRVADRPEVDVWPIQLHDQLPLLPIPLLEPDPDVTLDLGAMVTAVYQRGAYSTIIDYGQPPPPPPLSEAEQAWLEAVNSEQ
jgi:hypothetical protein